MRAPSSLSSKGSPSTASTCASTACATSTRRSSSTSSIPIRIDRGALVGILADDAARRIVAVAEFARLRDPAVAEVAFTVADELQGRGAATRLLEQLAARAAEAGIESFVAEVLPENAAMLSVFRDAGFEVVAHARGRRGRGALPDRADREVPGARRGARPRRGRRVAEAVLRAGDASRSSARRSGEARSAASSSATSSLPTSPARRTPSTPPAKPSPGCALTRRSTRSPIRSSSRSSACRAGACSRRRKRRCGRACPALCVISAGFAEVGSEGAERQAELLSLVRAHGARLVGPNCLGIAVPALGLNATFAPRALPPGRIAFSSQSGALGLALLEKASERGLGFSAFVSIGNKADVSSNDLLEWWEEDEDTDVVLLYLESFGNPQKFARVAGRVARRKPIVALKAGTSSAGARAASSHTAALAGSDAAVEALFQSAGVLRARNLEELVDVATLLSSQPLPKGRRVAVLTNAGGLGILCADACDAAGLELPELTAETRQALGAVLPKEASVANPVDLLGSATGATYAEALPHVLRDPGHRRRHRALRPAGRCGSRRGRRRDARDARARSARRSPCSPSS